ncbi:MAG: alpha/beta hydrolase [Chitinophagaceae bacterium]|nr:alpha/beta hydrolase [Chitinophagaceae bacterium]
MKKALFAALFISANTTMKAQDSIPLYPDGPPGALVAHNVETHEKHGTDIFVTKVSQPTLTAFLPPPGKGNGTAVIICPGGGYHGLSISKEGEWVAKELNKLGVAAFVLKYRLPDERIMKDISIGPLQDAQTAISIVRRRAKEWNIDVNKVGIMGFSAGGHLASTAATHFNRPVIQNKEAVQLRPDFLILLYPVISFSDSLAHMGSRTNLLGKDAPATLRDLYSNELQVTPQTPPTLLVHAGDDEVVKVGNSIRFYEALNKNGVPAELVVYPKGGHGFGLNNTTTTDSWMERCRDWMKSNGWLQ